MILNIAAYHFVHLEDPQALAAELGSIAEARGFRGTVLVAAEGINLFLAGDEAQVREFVAILRTDMRFAAIAIKESLSRSQPFARLKVKVKPEIIRFAAMVRRRSMGAHPPSHRGRSHAGSVRGGTTPAGAWCCWTRATARKSITVRLPAR